ncbi:2-oxoacid:acceptor oxidoreductase family protein [Acetonema longum]|uniref:Pyruvate/ketoisovalerate oxidoreductase, catalytic domain protein n=1 Tax=Acetonema longum DSM 6540 TaxID=1009370 RepID=F7NMW5_9FIRM|nr:2-oxoacid:acceptor oxidoreductase family protein [Acetonema longum]EGO62609.1 Pyruvate/ketoisovalerate oxidoreductase, catalytic domain protein [Acetonema longum DSM 6540]
MKHEMLFSGIGGQGIMLLGEVLCSVAVAAGYQVTFAPFYGQEKRGGRTMCHVVISDAMESPIISEAELMLIMDERSLQDFQSLMAPQGALLLNSSMIEREPACQCREIKKVPFYDIAVELGNAKVANMVALGALLKYLPFIPYDKVVAAVQQAFAAKQKVAALNVQALKAGYTYGF